jgi:MFS transporter, SP family, sugar:H+ symporter
MIYEIKGLTLEQVDELYGVVGNAWNSKKFRPKVRFAHVDVTAQRQMSLSEIGATQNKEAVQYTDIVGTTGGKF